MRFLLACAIGAYASRAFADADVIGITAVRQFDPTLTGTGVPLAQVEASDPGWQANPNVVNPLACQMSWVCGSGCSTNFPNALGTESGHADEVSRLCFGVAPGITQLDNYEAAYFTSGVIPNELPITARIVNQSFAYFARNTRVDQQYDNYAAKYNVLFVSGAGNSGWVRSPGTAYNGISVAAYGGSSSVGPSTDGRCKPDITAPGTMTSFSTPLVSGAAALLMQAGATDIRLIKALLLNGAQKPVDWTNCPASPLDARYGAGILNVFNSWSQFRKGTRRGWDLTTIASNEVRRYALNVRPSAFTATLVWMRHYGCTNISNLDMRFRNVDNELIARSESTLDNVEHIYLPNLASGSYTLEVSSAAEETYAVVFDFGPSIPPRLSGWTLTGEPNQRYLIETTTDFRLWIPWLTNTTSSAGIFEFAPDIDASARFFRAVELP